jgi:hypothetical protein
MPKGSAHQSSTTTKLLLIGDNGSGKTGALASLLDAGYNVRVLDLDNGLDALVNLLKSPKSPYKSGRAALDRLDYITLTDKMKSVGGKLVPGKATVWQRFISLLDDWKEPALEPDGSQSKGPDGKLLWVSNLGPITSWTSQDVLVIDSLTMAARAALNFILSMNGKLGGAVEQSHWYQGQQLIEGLAQLLYDDNVQCNVIVNCHITYIGEDHGPQRGYPATLGKALSPKLGSYFNSILMAKTTGSGNNQKRKILTNTSGVVELKNSAPMSALAEYPLETGLADYFRAVRGE